MWPNSALACYNIKADDIHHENIPFNDKIKKMNEKESLDLL